MHLDPDKIQDYVCSCCMPLVNHYSAQVVPGINLDNVANSDEFVEAVNKEIAARKASAV